MGLKQLNNVVDLTNKFHHVFFFGDLNYRIANTDTNVRSGGICAHKMILNIATCTSTFIQYIVLKLPCSISAMAESFRAH